MRKTRVLVSVVAAGVGVLSVVGISRATISGSPHDFKDETWNTTKDTCGVCHTPHHAVTPQLIPLWSHQSTESSFTPYDSPTLNATDVGQPSGVSKACLSCHDGSVAINSYNGVTGSEYVEGDALLSTDLSDDHPISFTYDTALANADGFLWDPSTVTVPLMGGKTIKAAMLSGDKLECSSCHDIHKQKGTSSTSQLMLVISGDQGVGSKLCLTCHNK